MADEARRIGPLDGIAGDGFRAGEDAVVLEDRGYLARFSLRGRPGDGAFTEAARGALGADLPQGPAAASRAGRVVVFWLQPDEWLVVAPSSKEAEIAGALAAAGLMFTPLGDGRATIRLSGARALDVLRKGTSLDVHPRSFRAGAVALTRLAQAPVLIHRTGRGVAFDLHVERSLAEYLWLWLTDAAREFGAEQPP